ncbi:MAG: PEGA domain-containing protein, partial [Treponema sp.]|nr:PEGA domain-containing protein [Treponema sp.]
MNKFYLLLTIFLFSAVCSLPASGKKDADNATYLNKEWILCVTAFDYSNLPPARRIAGDVITRNLVDKFKTVNHHIRVSPEYAYYEGYAWQQAVSTAAKALSSKQNERSQLLYRGDPDWKYRSNIKKIDADIKKLSDTLAEKEAEKPLIHIEPSFGLTQANINGTYPAPPAAGGERRFCQSQKADAFLTGEVREFHGRYYINLRLFTLYTNSYIYEDDIIFSMEDTDGAVEEIAARLTAVLSGNEPALVAVTADPPESQVLINRNYAGRGTVEARELPPGQITVAVAAEGYSPITVETELVTGELTDVAVTLSPLQYANVNINVLDGAGSSVYLGALYMGEAPLTLRLPLNQLEYITVENRKEMAKAVFSSPDL